MFDFPLMIFRLLLIGLWAVISVIFISLMLQSGTDVRSHTQQIIVLGIIDQLCSMRYIDDSVFSYEMLIDRIPEGRGWGVNITFVGDDGTIREIIINDQFYLSRRHLVGLSDTYGVYLGRVPISWRHQDRFESGVLEYHLVSII